MNAKNTGEKFTALGFYEKSVRSQPQLTREEEAVLQKRLMETRNAVVELEEKLARGSLNAAEKERFQLELVQMRGAYVKVISEYQTHYLGLVLEIAKRMTRNRKELDLEDAVQEGNLGLRRAIERFDPTRGFTLSTYAFAWIRQYIHRAQNQAYIVAIPDYIQLLIFRLNKVEAGMVNGKKMSDKEIADFLGISPDKLVAIRLARKLQRPAYLDVCLESENGDGAPMIEMISDENAVMPEVESIGRQVEEVLGELMNTLTPRERQILNERIEGKTLEQIGEEMVVTKERIRQIEYRVIEKLRDGLRRRELLEDLLG